MGEKQTKKKSFRPTPARFQNSVKILAGTKTNATIRDLDEEDDELQQLEGVVVSITRNKINGDGWVVKGSDGEIYQCSCASSMYEIPETVERGGILYPTGTVSVKFTVSPTLRRNTIIEITSLGEDESSLDIGSFTHGEEATTVIAKPKSALSVSNSVIKFNYDNTNQVTADSDSVTIDALNTNISSANKVNINGNQVNIDTEELNIKNEPLDNIINNAIKEEFDFSQSIITYPSGLGSDFLNTSTQISDVYLDKIQNMAQLSLINNKINLYENKKKLIMDILDQRMFPLRHQVLNGGSKYNYIVDVYPNGIITLSSDYDSNESVSFSVNWLAPSVGLRNCITISNPNSCVCCSERKTSMTFINYCPICNKWHTLTGYGQNIICNHCQALYCGSCGHNYSKACTDKFYDLKNYSFNKIKAQTANCDICKNLPLYSKYKTYVNYCPICNKWGYLIEKQESNQSILYCSFCQNTFCSNCGVNTKGHIFNKLSDYKILFDKEDDTFNDYFNKYNRQKLYYIE